MNFTSLTIKQIQRGLKKKDFTCLELVDFYLDRIKRVDEKINAFLFVNTNSVQEQAKLIDKKINKGEKLKELEGIPIAIKDAIMTKDLPTTAGSKILENYIASYDATVIKKLKDAGAIILGKTNMDEFAMGTSGENSAFGSVKNPWDLTRVPGGSSSGSASAVVAGITPIALGSDTGGSIRQPSSFCGVVGLKPTYGCVSRYGLIAMASSLDQIGPIAKSVEDAELLFNIIKGQDGKDSTSVSKSIVEKQEVKKLKIGIPREYFEGLNTEIKEKVLIVVKKLKELGCEVKDINLKMTPYALACYYVIMPAEVSANLARFDGIRYGYSNKEAKNLLEVYMKTRSQGFGDEVKRRIMLGTYVLSAGYYDAYYKKAQQVRTLVIQDFKNAFSEVDLILTPTTPTTAFKLGEKFADPLTMYLSDIYTVSANIAGIPGLSMPCGFVEREGKQLPVGLQILGDHFQEEKILTLASEYEKIRENIDYDIDV